MRGIRVFVVMLCAGALVAASAGALFCADAVQATGKAAPLMDKRALDALKTMSDTIAHAKSLQFQSRSMVPRRAPAGIWINLYGTSQVVTEGQGKLFARTSGDLAPHDFYFDGKTITTYSPDKNMYAVRNAPSTIDAMIEEAYREEGKSFPYADILVAEPYEKLTDGLVSAYYIGQSVMGGVKTDHLVFTNKDVEWQMWIGADDHLPRLVVATYLETINEPDYTVEFLDWKLNEPVSPDTFTFKNVSQAAEVEFRNPMQQRRVVPAATAVQK